MNNSENSEIETYFASIAENYDRIQPIIVGPSYDRGLQMVIDLIPYGVNDEFQFVELGCGTAEPSFRVLTRFPSARGICIDNEPAMLEIARKKLSSYQNRSVVQESDISVCKIPSCNVVYSTLAFHHVSLEKMSAVIQRIFEALSPGGCFILYEHLSTTPVIDTKVRQQWNRINQQYINEAVAAGRVTQGEIDARWSFKRRMKTEGKDTEYYHSAEDILQKMRESGFTESGLVWRMFQATILMGFKQE